jgi:hypothetical protein
VWPKPAAIFWCQCLYNTQYERIGASHKIGFTRSLTIKPGRFLLSNSYQGPWYKGVNFAPYRVSSGLKNIRFRVRDLLWELQAVGM